MRRFAATAGGRPRSRRRTRPRGTRRGSVRRRVREAKALARRRVQIDDLTPRVGDPDEVLRLLGIEQQLRSDLVGTRPDPRVPPIPDRQAGQIRDPRTIGDGWRNGSPHRERITLSRCLFRILGRVAVVGDADEWINIGPPRQRALLARLILDTNRVVTCSALVEALWGEDLPLHPQAALQVVVSRLRTNLGTYGARSPRPRRAIASMPGPMKSISSWRIAAARWAARPREQRMRTSDRRVRTRARAVDGRSAPGSREVLVRSRRGPALRRAARRADRSAQRRVSDRRPSPRSAG